MITILCALSFAMPIQQVDDLGTFDGGMVPFIEKDIDRWKPRPEDRFEPDSKVWARTMSITGRWSTDHYMSGSTLSVTPSGPGRFSVVLSSGGCLGAWVLRRSATFANGILLLDRPVKEYDPNTYDRLYAVNLAGGLHLISPRELARLTNRKELQDKMTVGSSSFAKVSTNPASRDVLKDGKILHLPRR